MPTIRQEQDGYKPPYDPFYKPVPIPTQPPTAEPLTCFSVNDEWLPYILGAVERLTHTDAWQGNEAQQLTAVQQAETLLDMLAESSCPPGISDDGCTEYPPNVPWITYAPNSPFTSPEYLPPGYVFPPWYTNPLVPLPGVLPSDAMVNFISLPVSQNILDVLQSGLPRARVSFIGMGELEIELVKVIQGGYAMVVVDDNFLSVEFINLNAVSLTGLQTILDLFGIVAQGSVNNTQVIEKKFYSPGEHHVDITFLPNVGTDVILGFGGGIRRVSLCNESLVGEVDYMPITDIRQNTENCKWEAMYNDDGNWIPIGDIFLPQCAPTAPNQIRVVNNCQLQQTYDGVNWGDVPDGQFVPIDGDCPMTNGLMINTQPSPGGRHGLLVTMNAAAQQSAIRVHNSGGGILADIDKNGTYRSDMTFNSSLVAFEVRGGGYSVILGQIGRLAHAGVDGLMYLRQIGAKSLVFENTGAAGCPVIVRGQSGQTGDLQRWDTITGTTRTKIMASGSMEIGAYDTSPSNNFAGVTINRESTVTPVSGFGTGVRIIGKSTGTSNRDLALLRAAWENPTDAERTSKFTIYAYDSGGQREGLSIGATGEEPKISFLGEIPRVRQTLPDLTNETPAVVYLAEKLRDFGLFKDVPVIDPPGWCVDYPFIDADYWVLWPDAANQNRTNGVYSPGIGWASNNGNWSPGTVTEQVLIYKTFAENAILSRAEIYFDVQNHTAEQYPGHFYLDFRVGSNWITVKHVEIWASGSYFTQWIDTPVYNVSQVRARLYNNQGGQNPSMVIQRITLSGDDPEPSNTNGDACP